MDTNKLWNRLAKATDFDFMRVEDATEVYNVFGELVDMIDSLKEENNRLQLELDTLNQGIEESEQTSWQDDFSKIMDSIVEDIGED